MHPGAGAVTRTVRGHDIVRDGQGRYPRRDPHGSSTARISWENVLPPFGTVRAHDVLAGNAVAGFKTAVHRLLIGAPFCVRTLSLGRSSARRFCRR